MSYLSTGSFLPENLLPNDLKNHPVNLDDFKRRIFLLEANRDLNVGWRDSDGTLINKIDGAGNLEEPCISDKSKEIRLDKNSSWGLLMGFIKNDQEKISEIISDNKRIFKIGKRAIINYDKNQGDYVIETGSDRTTINKTFEGCELYFIVNDALVKNQNDLDYPSLCGNPTEFETGLRDTHKRIYEKIIPKENAIGFYYLDNLGNFVVSILVE